MELLRDPELYKHLSIPLVAAFVGWATNWMAIRLTFRPLDFRGIRPLLGWQGIIPSKAGKMAAIFADSAMFRLGTLPELFEKMEPDEIADHVTEVLDRNLERYVEEAVFWSGRGAAWRALPGAIRRRIVGRVRDDLPRIVAATMAEITARIEELLDFKQLLIEILVADKELLNRLFLEAGEVEFRFIVRSGATFGFLFGLVQLGVWLLYPAFWVLPAFGFLVGWATNWIALNIIFRPLEPVRVGRWTVQGLFLKRQPEVAAVWCRLVTRQVVTVRRIMYALLTGPRSAEVHALIRSKILPEVDEALGVLGPAAALTVGPAALDEIKRSAADRAVEVSTEPFDHWGFNEERAEVVERFLRERMEELPPSEFQELLRPCFKEDEWKLILLGGVLGGLAGLAQIVLVFGG